MNLTLFETTKRAPDGAGTIGDLRSQTLSLLWRRRIQVVVDLSVLVGAFGFAYLLRFDFAVPEEQSRELALQLPYVVLIQFCALVLAGIYTFIWRYIGMAEIRSFLIAAVVSFLPVLILRFCLPASVQQWRVPVSIAVMDTVFGFGVVLSLRVLRRALYEKYDKRPRTSSALKHERRRVLLVGAGRGGMQVAREIAGRGDSDLEVKGFIDNAPDKLGAVIQGIQVLGTTGDLPRLAKELDIDHVVITITNATRKQIRGILEICEQIPLKVRIVPDLYDIVKGQLKVTRIRDVQLEDLLGRAEVELEELEIAKFLTNKRVLITGAGGSIGSELARNVARFQPSALMLLERAEYALFEIERELRCSAPSVPTEAILADITDEAQMRRILELRQPQVILHAAAHKHVPLMEYCPSEAVRNNALGTHTLARSAGECGVESFVLISSDKAVRPTSVMGATKRVAELFVQEMNRRYDTRYVAVRFGNVIGSAGSVIPIFQEQIRKGGPVTVTHPAMVRYFMTIPEAAQLVLQAGAIGEGGEIFVLDMGEPVNILDLAKDTITLTGLRPFDDVEIAFTGVRPGEKLFEELEITDEQMTRTRHPKIFIGKIAAYRPDQVRWAVEGLATLCEAGRDLEVRAFLSQLLPEAQLAERNPDDASTRAEVAATYSRLATAVSGTR
jgi:FlaA1/EpsC-like NDP-sugar epimerase